MSDGRFYSLLLVTLLLVTTALLLLFNWLQRPEGLDRALMTTLLAGITPTVAVLLNNMSNSKQAAQLLEGQQKLKDAVENK